VRKVYREIDARARRKIDGQRDRQKTQLRLIDIDKTGGARWDRYKKR
jgi:hypothetical protein